MEALKRRLDLGFGFFGSGSTNTPVFNQFFKDFKKQFEKVLIMFDAEDISFSKGHFDLHGFFRVGDQWFYFSLGDVRSNNKGEKLLIRKAKNNKDFTGETNNFFRIEKKSDMIRNIARAFNISVTTKGKSRKHEKKISDYAKEAIENGTLYKYIGSCKKACRIAWEVDSMLRDDDERGTSIQIAKFGNTISYSKCSTDKFSFRYDGSSKYISIDVYDTFKPEEFLRSLKKPKNAQTRVNPFTGNKVTLEPVAVALHDFIKKAEVEGNPIFGDALLIFRQRYPDEYYTLLD